MHKIGLVLIVALSVFVLDASRVHADYQLIRSEIAQKQLSQMWRDVNVEKGQALYTDDTRGVLYRWSVPKSIGPNGAPFEMSAESRLFRDYIEAAISVDANFGATFKGDLNSPIKFKDENPANPMKQSRNGQIIAPTKGDEFSVMVRMGATVGEDATVVYTYSNKAAVTPPPTTNVTVSADLKTNVLQLRSGETVSGTLNVDISGLPDNKGELEFTAFLTTYGLTDIIDDFGPNYMSYLTNKELGGTYTNERVKYRTTAYLHTSAHNGNNTYKFEDIVPVKIPAGLEQGQYLLIVFVRVKDTKVFTTTRAGIDLANIPKRIILTAPAKVSPQEGFQGENFYLELKYAVEGIAEEEKVNLRVRGNLTGPEQMGVAEKTLNLGNDQSMGKGIYKQSGEITIATDDVKDAGEYIWNYTIYAGGGFAPYDGQIPFKVNAGVSGMDQGVPAGRVRIEGLGKVGELQINDGSGWKKVSDGFLLTLTDQSARVRIRTDIDQPTLVFPNGRKIIVRPDTEMSLQGDQGDASLTYGELKVFGPSDKTKKIKVGTMGGIVIEEEGTIFTVTYDPKAKTTTITVEEGVVVATPQNPNMKPVRVKAGDKVTLGDVVDVAAQDPSDKTGIIDTVSSAAGAEATPDGKAFENRVRHLFSSQNISDNIAYDTFAAMSLIIVKKALPGSCYNNDPYVSYPTWDAHRKYAIERGRAKSADNMIWKTGGTLTCLSSQSDKDALLAELNEVLRQAESGQVTRIADAASTSGAAQYPADQSRIPGVYRWDWARSGDPFDQGATATFHADGRVDSSYGFSGKWRVENGTILIDWANGDTNTLRLTADPNIMEGQNKDGWKIRASKKVSYDSGNNPIDPANVPGVWKWDWNKSGEPLDQGAGVTFNMDGTMTSTYAGFHGTWKVEGGKLNLLWLNVNETNTLYGTSDPKVMEGQSQWGARIRATKKEGFTAQNSSYEYGIDRQGWDYDHFPLSAPNPDLCASRCQQESQCRAWTYVKPGYQGPEPMCWLKNSVPPQIKGADFAVSGVVRP